VNESGNGPSRHFACAQQSGRFRREADINRQAEPAGSVENDPERTWVVPDFCGACCRPYRLFVEAAAVRLITSRVALMTRSG